MLKQVFVMCASVLAAATSLAQTPAESWLDRPISNWNFPGRAVTSPVLAPRDEAVLEVAKRCSLPMLRSTPGERVLAEAGWVPFHVFDRQIVQRDVEVIGGLAGADGMCRPADFNVFVFVNGRLAGTLSPETMVSRMDGSIGGGVRLGQDDTIVADFSRFANEDPLCCPSRRVTVAYRLDRTATPPVVVPVNIRATRQ